MFENVDGSDVAIKDLVTVGNPVGGASLGASDQIWVWDTATASWTKYYYYSGRQGKKWLKSTDAANASETIDTIATGKTFFFCRSAGASGTTTLTLSGKVKALDGESSFTVSANQLAFASNPWPVELNVKDISNYYTNGTPVGGASLGASDQIWLWDTATAGWTKYYYYSGRQGKKWLKSTDAANADETTDAIPAGAGFFFQRSSGASATATITFTK